MVRMVLKAKELRPVHPNIGLEVAYRRRLQALINEMHFSVLYWVEATYKQAPPTLAQDAKIPSKVMQQQLKDLAKRWQKRFNDAAPKIADAYLQGAFKRTDSAMRAALKAAGFSVEFQMTPAMRDAFQASLAENVGLIKSIPAEYLQKVEGQVMRSYTVGGDLAKMVKSIKRLYPEVSERAVLISRDQNNKANAVVTRTRQLELGVTKAIWQHSAGGKVPRPSHVAASGREYYIEKGCLIDGEYIYPGQKINCRCVSRSVLPGLSGSLRQ